MFDKKTSKKVDTVNVRNPAARKVRSDKKWDIKIPLTLEQRRIIKRLAQAEGMYPTNYCTYVVKKGLTRGLFFPAEEQCYPADSDLCYPVKLEERFLTQLDEWVIKYDYRSRRQAAYRILWGIIRAEGAGGHV